MFELYLNKVWYFKCIYCHFVNFWDHSLISLGHVFHMCKSTVINSESSFYIEFTKIEYFSEQI